MSWEVDREFRLAALADLAVTMKQLKRSPIDPELALDTALLFGVFTSIDRAHWAHTALEADTARADRLRTALTSALVLIDGEALDDAVDDVLRAETDEEHPLVFDLIVDEACRAVNTYEFTLEGVRLLLGNDDLVPVDGLATLESVRDTMTQLYVRHPDQAERRAPTLLSVCPAWRSRLW
jgi:hypothetical protein